MTEGQTAVAALRDLLSVEEIDTGIFRGAAVAEQPGRVYGGQVVAQALAAAARGIDPERQAHSLHAYFLRAGDAGRPIIYRVLPDFDGNSFSNRRVVAMQGGKPILNLAASFHRPEEGLSHAVPMPDVPAPEQCPDFRTALTAAGQKLPAFLLERLAAFDIRPCPPVPQGGLPHRCQWFRLAAPLGDDAVMQRVVLAYASDFALISTALMPHGMGFFSPGVSGASLDHAIWFHQTPPIDDWLLYAMDSPWSGHARGFARGAIYSRDGTLVASVAQEGLLRVKPQD
ncbi:acyl-CoA thioesterase-2 [Novosphingobium sp. PhB165]|uniref:acyl-CoA thioesterase n=1 Tax=Novosphingobium sp. PhB165 TaxID=2485105 RepID=UPI00105232FA|nr:acyl-CoA thioesterase II [Novosphingobium sp. PhB165]TCM19776.1 acyl-CoA thioesterase-2 [Novosphingobium sp. PhB165]